MLDIPFYQSPLAPSTLHLANRTAHFPGLASKMDFARPCTCTFGHRHKIGCHMTPRGPDE